MSSPLIRVLAVAVCLTVLLMTGPSAFAVQTEPATLNYQGTLTDNGGQPLTGSKTLTIGLYTTLTGGTAFWSDTYNVTLLNGQFSVTLGSDANPLSPQLAQFNGVTYVGVQVGSDPEMTPRQKLTSVPYAFNGIPRGGIIMWSGAVNGSGYPIINGVADTSWHLCDGSNGTPDLRDRFIVGAGSGYAVGTTGGGTINLQHQHDLQNHIHKGYGDGGDLRAAVGAVNDNVNSLGYITLTAGNPNGGGIPNASYIVYGVSSDANFNHWNHFTPVFGYTSPPNINNTGSAGNASQAIIPPYYALAYIMKL